MDALTFGSTVLLRHMTFSEARKMPIQEIHLDKVLSELELTQTEVCTIYKVKLTPKLIVFNYFQFIDLCILLGCDYCDSIRGIGPKRAIELIKKHRNLEAIIESLDSKYTVPEGWIYKEARELFVTPEVHDPESLEVIIFLIVSW